MTAVRVQVTQQDIDNGKHDAAYCPCALAARRALPRFPHLRFGSGTWSSSPGIGSSIRQDLPANVSRWITDYDSLRDVEPFEFDLDVPADLLAGAS